MLHFVKFVVMFIGSVVTSHIHNGVVWRKTRQSVDVSVGVIASQAAMIELKNLLNAQVCFKAFFYLLFVKAVITVGCEQAIRCGQKATLAVGFY